MKLKGGTLAIGRVPYIGPGCTGPIEQHRCQVGVQLWHSGPPNEPAPVTGCRCSCHRAERLRLAALASEQFRRLFP